ncbi:MAG: DUF4118 domain-containing protein [Rubrivivax sp.]|nr:DUF4118 domain-containing protein [Rubrivivax sp.]
MKESGVPIQARTPAADPPPVAQGAPLPEAHAGPARAPRDRVLAALVRASAVLALCTATGEVLAPFLEPANLIMVYLAGLVYIALRLGRPATLYGIAASLFLFDLLYVAPRWSLKPADPQYFLTFAVMIVVGLVIGHLADRSREQARAAESRAARNQALNRMALQLASAGDAAGIGRALDAAVAQALGARARLLDTIPPQPAGADARVLPLPAGPSRPGAVRVTGLRGQPLPADDEELLRAFVNQAAIALERVRYERLSAESAMTADRERLRSTLLAGISHDFRTPLTTIIGATSSLLDQDAVIDPERRRALLQQVLGESERLHQLVSDLLDLTRFEAGAVRPDCEWCPLDELVQEAWRALGPATERHRLGLDVPDELPLWCDARLMGQALGNLLGNAVKHSPAGSVVTVRARRGPEDVLLAVHDQGSGVARGHERRVFEKFFRSGDAGGHHGTGLGLAICAAVAELHQGTISARNEQGACFELRLPQPAQPPGELVDEGGAA